ncbi:MAG: protein kinase [Myxococcales bacterium]|nr:protein kinase [Myxococcales bacterium]
MALPERFGSYELLQRLATGGMAEVFRARDKKGQLVALKRILPTVAEDEEFVAMFLDEARITSRLSHPHIARLVEFGKVDDRYFIAYEYVDGRDLRQVFERMASLDVRLPLRFLLYVFTRVGEGLAYAHARKDESGESIALVHRDVSPQNIVVSYSGDVKLIDFGIAKARGKVSRTQAGTIKGKFGYMSPEQVRSAASVDQRTDVFSLGVCMWELLTGKRLFTGPNEIMVLEKVRNQEVESPSRHDSKLPQELDKIVLKALAKSPDERYRSARELYKELNAFSEFVGATATRDEIARTMRELFGETDVAVRRASDAPPGGNGNDLRSPEPRRERIMQLQETRMSDDNKGSDLDIFEGLGKKKKEDRASAAPAPPPPPRSSSAMPAAPAFAQPVGDMKRTLIGQGVAAPPLPPPAQSAPPAPPPASVRPPPPPPGMQAAPAATAPSTPPTVPSQPPFQAPPIAARSPSSPGFSPGSKVPPPPPGRGSLPALGPQTPPGGLPSGAPTPQVMSAAPATVKQSAGPVSAAPPTTPMAQSAQAAQVAQTKPQNGSGNLDMDWDDEDEATHVFDKEKSQSSQMPVAPAAGTPPPPAAGAPARASAQPPPEQRTERADPDILTNPKKTLVGLNGFAAPPPPPPPPPNGPGPASMRGASAPPPPPPPGRSSMTSPPSTAPIPSAPPSGVGSAFARASSVPAAQGNQSTQPIPMPGPMGNGPSQPPLGQPRASVPAQPISQAPAAPSVAPSGQMSSRAMEATAVVRPQPQPKSNTGLLVGLGVVALGVIAAAAVFVAMPRNGKVVVNVADGKGATVDRVEVFVDGKKQCDTAPCVIETISAGEHQVKVLASGFEPVASRAVTVETRKSTAVDFTLVTAGASAKTGTGVKVAGNQPGVKLYVDGKEIGSLPQELTDLAPGDHKLRIAGSDRYAAVERSVIVEKDKIEDLGPITLKVLKGKATVQLGTPGAKVYIVSGTDRRELPMLPISVDIDTSKSWALEASKVGFNDYKMPISFEDGQAEKTFNVTLDVKGAPVATTAQTTAPVTTTAATTAPTTPPTAATTPPTTTAAPTASAKPTATAQADKGEAFLNINSLPASSVVLDGKPLGPTPQVKVKVTPGNHTVLFINSEQQLKKTISVSVGAGETKAAFAKLRE